MGYERQDGEHGGEGELGTDIEEDEGLDAEHEEGREGEGVEGCAVAADGEEAGDVGLVGPLVGGETEVAVDAVDALFGL